MSSRREFLHAVTGSTIAFSLLPEFTHAAYPVTGGYEGPKLKVALMGLGSYASRVAEAMQLCKKAVVTGLVSGTPAKIKRWQEKYHIPETNCYNYENYDEVKNNPDIDAVYVITPNGLHHDAVLRIAKAGKHVICEKPMAVNAREGEDMVAACKRAKVKLLVGYRMHFEPNTLEIIRMRSEGRLGKIRFFQGLCGFTIGDPRQWRLNRQLSGGGSLMDIGIYAVNGSRYMVGEEPVWITAQETKTDPVKFQEGVDETIQFQMGFPGGAVASCLSTYNMNYLDRFFLDGGSGFAELQPAAGYGPIRGRTSYGELNHPHVPHQAIQMDEMAGIILEGSKPLVAVDGEEAVKDLKIMDAIYKAAGTGKRIEI